MGLYTKHYDLGINDNTIINKHPYLTSMDIHRHYILGKGRIYDYVLHMYVTLAHQLCKG